MNGFIERFQDRIMPEANSGCWLWIAAASSQGYGEVTIDGRAILAHRASFISSFGPISKDKPVIRHRCDTPQCVNPDHLGSGTQADNMRDRFERNRAMNCIGERNHNAKLTRALAIELKTILQQSRRPSYRALARQFGVSHQAIGFIAIGKNWRHAAIPTAPLEVVETK
jgi:hypothetical protein